MRRFAELFEELDTTTSTNEKLAALVRYFGGASAEDAAWAAYFLSGRRLKRIVGPATLREWLIGETGMPQWLLEETYAEVGDLAETIALLIDAAPADTREDLALADWIERLLSLPGMTSEQQRKTVAQWWRNLVAGERFLLNKLLTGELRVGVSSGLVERALAQLLGLPRPVIAHRLTGTWQPSAQFWAALKAPAGEVADTTRPYPFCLASPLEQDPQSLGPASEWLVEWKWDGIRAQVMRRAQSLYIWSRGEELITERFPEVVQRALRLPTDTVIDGEILAWRDGQVQSFADLQQRIGRKTLSARIVSGAPVRFLAYDLLELGGEDLRARPLRERRALLEQLLVDCADTFEASPLLRDHDWSELQTLRETSRERRVEGMMLKHSESPYVAGRQRGTWWKWKVDPYTFDGVLIYAEPGRGRRANLLTDYTFAVRDGEAFVPVAKAYSGLSDSEISRVDRWIRQNTLERFGPVRSVRPELVFEIAFEGIAASTRHKSGVAVRFPRIARWRDDKPAAEANTLQDLLDLLRVG
ncbi:MAG TPA: ATP-dependent DNA ligase [Steroidobacteraceae bacterium]|nr:ATP-dependent DNA ligase [Steroidobacteraceae bacterium]